MKLLGYKRHILKICMLFMSGSKRASLLKRLNYFHQQGDHCRFYVTDFGTEPYLISFGQNVEIASEVKFVTHNDAVSVFRAQANGAIDDVGSIEIGDNVFIGTRAILLPNITIGSNVIVGAGAVVNKDVSEGSVVAGVPAREIGKTDDWIAKRVRETRDYSWINTVNVKELRQKHFFGSK